MSGGPVAAKLLFLEQYLRSRAGEGGHFEPDPLTLQEMQQMAGVIAAIAETVAVMENRPVPPRLRVISGGRQ